MLNFMPQYKIRSFLLNPIASFWNIGVILHIMCTSSIHLPCYIYEYGQMIGRYPFVSGFCIWSWTSPLHLLITMSVQVGTQNSWVARFKRFKNINLRFHIIWKNPLIRTFFFFFSFLNPLKNLFLFFLSKIAIFKKKKQYTWSIQRK